MKKKVCFLLCFLVINGLVSCNIPSQYLPDSSQSEVEQHYGTVSVLLTQTAQGLPVSIIVPVASATPSPEPPFAVSKPPAISNTEATLTKVDPLAQIPMASKTPRPAVADGQALAAPCDLAQLGYPIDINVPDGSRFLPGEYFSKTWRLVNAGSCPWTRDYALVWFSGTNLGLNQVQPLGSTASWGASIDVTVDMMAPAAPGTYQSNWKMRNSAGELFGIGPNGDAPFWVRIVVVPVDTPTVTATIFDATPTPVIYASGSLILAVGEGIDLDTARINQEQEDDVRLLSPETGEIQLAPLTGVHLVSFGAIQPQLFDCGQDNSTNAPVMLEQAKVGMYLCYRTTRGLPGRMMFKSIDFEKGQIDLDFITWVVP